MTVSKKWFKSLLALIDERGGMTKDEVEKVCRAQVPPSATITEAVRMRKRLHWNEMVVYDLSGDGPGKYKLTEYGRKALSMDDKAFERALTV